MLRHGDILLKRVKKPGKELEKEDGKIVEYGEATGHKHELQGQATIYKEKDTSVRYVHVMDGELVEFIHPEHDTIHLDSGWYAITRQREYNPYKDAIRYVTD